MAKRTRPGKSHSSGKRVSVPDRFGRFLTESGASPVTIRGYLADVSFFINWFEASKSTKFNPKAVTVADLEDYRSYLLRDRSGKPATVNRRLIALARFFKWAKNHGVISNNPAEALPRQKVQREAPKMLSGEEQQALIQAVERGGSKRDMAIIKLLLGTGIKLSELSNLLRSNVDLVKRGGVVRVEAGKGMQVREIPLSREGHQTLKWYLADFSGKGDAPLFPGRSGALSAIAIWELVKKYTYQARLERCTPQILRNTFARNLAEAGTPIDEVARLLGLESLDAAKIYYLNS